MAHGLAESVAQLEMEPPEFKSKVIAFLDGLISHYVLDDGKLVVAHAGMKEEMQGRGSGAIRSFALFRETTGETDEFGLPVRISPRHAFETRIWIRLQRDGEKLSLQGWSRDLSESGVGAFVAEALILSESVTLEIPLPDCDKQVIPAKVVRALGTEYGFQFPALSAEQRRQIRATLKERPAIPRQGAGR